MDYKEFEKAVDTLELCSKSSLEDLKRKYKELSKKYHPDMPQGDEKKFMEINKSYKIVKNYMTQFRYTLEEWEFKEQFPFFIDQKNWF
jgi:DnaJ-class molecular chaperone